MEGLYLFLINQYLTNKDMTKILLLALLATFCSCEILGLNILNGDYNTLLKSSANLVSGNYNFLGGSNANNIYGSGNQLAYSNGNAVVGNSNQF